ncbi:MAG TPA: hypothetical protein VK085_10210 [Pseudogracilibacillus sp.]|nr:hypothetical protein [Pseudogracilibacillus sp.]
MNMHVVLLFANAIIATVLAAIIVLIILRKEYLPVIKELERKQSEGYSSNSEFNKDH